MALNFPNSPTVGQVYTDTTSGFSYEWDGTVWKSYSPASASNIKIIDDISGSFNGSTQTFALAVGGVSLTPANAQSLIISLGGVVQEPGTDYTVSTSNIIFDEAPQSGLNFGGVSLGPAVPVTYANDGNIYIRNTYTGAGTTGPFSFPEGYTVGYLDVYRNGVRLRSGTDFVGTSGTNFFLTDAAQVNDELEAIGYTITALVQASSSLDNLNVTGITTTNRLNVSSNANVTGIVTASGGFVGPLTGNVTGTATGLSGTPNVTVGLITATEFDITGSTNTLTAGGLTVGVATATTLRVGTAVTISAGVVTATSFVGSLTGTASTASFATTSFGLSGTPNITVGNVVGSALSISGISTLGITSVTDIRIASIADKTTIVVGSAITLAYNTGGGNVAICSSPTGPITLNITGIPTDSSFDNRAISFAVIVQQSSTAYACTNVTLNGVAFGANAAVGVRTAIAYPSGTVATATTTGYDVFNFTGINTVGSASTTANYKILGNVNGGYRLY